MVKWLNCCGEADHLLFCNHYAGLLILLKYSISTPNNLYPICRAPTVTTFINDKAAVPDNETAA